MYQFMANSFQTTTEVKNQQFEAVFNYATIGMVVTDERGCIVDFNHYAETQFGYEKDELLGLPIETLIPQKFHHSHIKYRNEFYHAPAPRKMGEGRDLYAKRKDGSVFPVEVSLSHYQLQQQQFVIAFVIDITVRKKNEELLLQRKQELEQYANEIKKLNTELEHKVEDRTKMLRETLSALEKSKEELSEALQAEKELGELKSRFVTMASHEFRTPLSTILSSVYLIEKYVENAADVSKTKKHIHRIKSAVSDMKDILEDFLSLGKLDEGLIKVKPETLSATQYFNEINHVLTSIEPMLKAGQTIDFTHNNSVLNIEIDIHLLKNILMNLLSNAIKFSPEQSIIQLQTEVQPEMIFLSVKDNGIGISEEDQAHLFERFFRARNASNIQGTGLGLHIVAKYLQLISGNIQLKSRLNEGTEVMIHIPQPLRINDDNAVF